MDLTKCPADGCTEYAFDGHCHIHTPTCAQVGHVDGGAGPCERCPPPGPHPLSLSAETTETDKPSKRKKGS